MSGVFYILLACILWALDTLVRYPLLGQGISAERIVFTEHLILTVIFLPILFKNVRKFWQAKVAHVFYFLIIGGLGSAIGTLAFTRAFGLINPSLVILLQKFQPIVAIILARFILHERLNSSFFKWGFLCLIGAGLISFEDISMGLDKIDMGSDLFSQDSLVGYLLALVAVVSWGSSTVFGKKLSLSGLEEKEIMAGRFTMGLVCLLPILFTGQMNLDLDGAVWGKVLLMVFLSGILGMFFYYKGLKIISARLCAICEMFFPLCAVLVNWIFLSQSLSVYQIFGGLLLLIGSTVIQLRHY
ncbi:DMT family transporter [Halobacteriovorax sp. HLS]|uniref:DMT family transporter n=1 Tax=Halobacteriovorax sp. HLS TaxID=2234000 RepID=UPI000FD8294A|nr:DMT family transporter [Halobacteriovorax sp. HLS]